MGDDHAALDAAQHGGALIVGKVDAAHLFQHRVDVGEALLIGEEGVVFRLDDGVVLGIVQKFVGDVLGREHVIDHAGGDGALGHAVKLGRGRLLHDGEPAFFLGGLDAARAVRAGAGEDHGDGVLLFLLGQGIQEYVDGMVERSLHVVAQKQPAGMIGDVFFGGMR